MILKSSVKVIIIFTIFVLQSCCSPGVSPLGGSFNGGFPTSVSETHTKTTIVTPPSYPVVNMPPPSIQQAAPVIQQPMMIQQPQFQQYAPQSSDPCAYQVQVPTSQPAKYTIAIPPAPAPQYTIALPQGNPPQYAVVQNQAPVTSTHPIQIQAKAIEPCVLDNGER